MPGKSSLEDMYRFREQLRQTANKLWGEIRVEQELQRDMRCLPT